MSLASLDTVCVLLSICDEDADDDQERGKLWLSDGLAISAQYEASAEHAHFIEEKRVLVDKNSEVRIF